MTGTGGAAAREMPLIHRIFRTEFRSHQQLVTEADPADPARVAAIADHVGFMLDSLHMHHTTEDDLIWPRLLERATMQRPQIERMEEQHHLIDAAVQRVREAVDAWAVTPTPATAGAVESSLAGFIHVLEEHLDEEERDVVPLIDEHLTADEWEQLGKTAFAKFTPAQRWIAMGQMVEVASPEEREMMFGTLPAPVKVLWRLVGQRRYRRYLVPIRGEV